MKACLDNRLLRKYRYFNDAITLTSDKFFSFVQDCLLKV